MTESATTASTATATVDTAGPSAAPAHDHAAFDRLIAFYEHLSEAGVGRFAEFYSPDAYFKDPFNEVRGIGAIQRIFQHMFRQVQGPRFVVTQRFCGSDGVMLIWQLRYRTRWLKPADQVMHGSTHLRFAPDGKVCYHRDYWDTGEELYARVPLVGCIVRGVARALAA